MPQSRGPHARLGALCLAVAGTLFVLYPAIRPFSDETTLQGAEAFASNAWIVAHVLAMLGFILLSLGVLGACSHLRQGPGERPAALAVVLSWVGAGLTLPYYGAEAFGLHAIGQEAVRQHNPTLVHLAAEVRNGPGLILFVPGLLMLGLGAIALGIAVWRSGVLPRWSGVPFALGFALYIPQFFGNQPIRVAHGILVAGGCLWLGARR